MSEELLPCPFCGSDARIWPHGLDKYRVACTQCVAAHKVSTRSAAIKGWNTRVESAENAQLREKLVAVRTLLVEKRHNYANVGEVVTQALAIIDGTDVLKEGI